MFHGDFLLILFVAFHTISATSVGHDSKLGQADERVPFSPAALFQRTEHDTFSKKQERMKEIKPDSMIGIWMKAQHQRRDRLLDSNRKFFRCELYRSTCSSY